MTRYEKANAPPLIHPSSALHRSSRPGSFPLPVVAMTTRVPAEIGTTAVRRPSIARTPPSLTSSLGLLLILNRRRLEVEANGRDHGDLRGHRQLARLHVTVAVKPAVVRIARTIGVDVRHVAPRVAGDRFFVCVGERMVKRIGIANGRLLLHVDHRRPIAEQRAEKGIGFAACRLHRLRRGLSPSRHPDPCSNSRTR